MKIDLRVAVTKRMIQEALMRLLKTKPVDKIKISELCAESGVNRATFYRHYETLRDVLYEIELQFIQQMPRPSTPPKNVEEAHSRMEALCTYFYENADLFQLLFLNRTDGDMMQSVSDLFSSFLELWKQESPMPNMDEDTANVLITLICGGSYFLLRRWIMGDIQKTPAEVADILCDVIHWHAQIGAE